MEESLQDFSYCLIEDDKVLAEIDFPLIEEGIIEIDHTFVDDSLRGKGTASRLVEKVIEIAQDKDLRIKASCSYAKGYFAKHPSELYIGDID